MWPDICPYVSIYDHVCDYIHIYSYTYIYIKFSDFERKRPFLSATTSPNTTARCTISSLRAREWCRDDFSFSSFLRFFFFRSFARRVRDDRHKRCFLALLMNGLNDHSTSASSWSTVPNFNRYNLNSNLGPISFNDNDFGPLGMSYV